MPPQTRMSPRAWAELLLLSLIWGGIFLATRIALDEVPVFTLVAHRVGWAALILWGIVALRRVPLPRSPATWAAFLIMGALNNVIPFSLLAWGQLHIESGLTSILNAATAVFGVLVAALIFPDERLTANRLTGVLLGFLGVATTIGLGALASFDVRSLAQLAILGGALSYALAGAWARKTLGHHPPLLAAAGMLTGSTLIMVPLAWSIDGPITLSLSFGTWTALAYCALIGTVGAYLLYYRVLAMAGSGNLLLCTLLIPPVAILLGAVFLGEALTANAFLGFAILGVGLLTLDGRLFRRGRNTA